MNVRSTASPARRTERLLALAGWLVVVVSACDESAGRQAATVDLSPAEIAESCAEIYTYPGQAVGEPNGPLCASDERPTVTNLLEVCQQARFPSGGACYECMIQHCCVPSLCASDVNLEPPEDGLSREGRYRSAFDTPLACIRSCFAQERDDAPSETGSSCLVQACAKRCIAEAEYPAESSPDYIQFQHYYTWDLLLCLQADEPSLHDEAFREDHPDYAAAHAADPYLSVPCRSVCFPGY